MWIFLVILIILIYFLRSSCFSNFTSSNMDFDGYAAEKYMDESKWYIINNRQEPYKLFDAVNTFHTGDVLAVLADEWTPVAKVVSVMEVDAFCVLVLDKPVPIYGMKIKSLSVNKQETIFPDAIKRPFDEIKTVSRFIRPPGDVSNTPVCGCANGVCTMRAPYAGNWAEYRSGNK